MKLKIKNRSRYLFLGLLLLVLILTGIGVYFGLATKKSGEQEQDVVAIVDGEKISLVEYKRWLFAATDSGTPEKPTKLDDYIKEPVLNDLVRYYVLKKEATKLGITIDEEELMTSAKARYSSFELVDEKGKAAYNEAAKLPYLENAIKEKVVAWSEGSFVACRFDRYIQDDYIGKEAEAKALLEKQQPHAKTLCETIKKEFEGGASYGAEYAKVESDGVIGKESWKPFLMTLGREFKKDNFSPSQTILGTSLFQKIKELNNKKGTYLVEAESYRDSDDLKSGVPGLYAVVNLTGNGNDGPTTDFDQWVQEKVDAAKVQRYLERIKL